MAGVTTWLTGLPCAGKTTVSQRLAQRLQGHGIEPVVLDGDAVRQSLSRDLGFSREDRATHIRRVGSVCKLLTRQNAWLIVAVISPYEALRSEVRAEIGSFVEVHVSCPLNVCEQRDVKGMYARARAGELPDFTGVEGPYEKPSNPEVVLHTADETVDQSVDILLGYLTNAGYLSQNLL